MCPQIDEVELVQMVVFGPIFHLDAKNSVKQIWKTHGLQKFREPYKLTWSKLGGKLIRKQNIERSGLHDYLARISPRGILRLTLELPGYAWRRNGLSKKGKAGEERLRDVENEIARGASR